jgi:hypothetical protein
VDVSEEDGRGATRVVGVGEGYGHLFFSCSWFWWRDFLVGNCGGRYLAKMVGEWIYIVPSMEIVSSCPR